MSVSTNSSIFKKKYVVNSRKLPVKFTLLTAVHMQNMSRTYSQILLIFFCNFEKVKKKHTLDKRIFVSSQFELFSLRYLCNSIMVSENKKKAKRKSKYRSVSIYLLSHLSTVFDLTLKYGQELI